MKNSPKISRLIAFLSLAFLVFACGAQISAQNQPQKVVQQSAHWKTFSPAGTDFRISLPAEPRRLDESESERAIEALHKQLSKSEGRPAFMDHFKFYELDDKWAKYVILVLDYKWQTLEYDKENLLVTLSSEKTTDESIYYEWLQIKKAKPAPGGIYIGENTSQANTSFVKAKSFVTKNKVYLLAVITSDYRLAPVELHKIYQSDVDRFFNSFQMLNDKTQAAKHTTAQTVSPASGNAAPKAKLRDLKWKSFMPAGMNFKVNLPQEPNEVQLPAGLNGENVKAGLYELEMRGTKFSISITVFSKDTYKLDEARKAAQEILKMLPGESYQAGQIFIVSHKESMTNNSLVQESVMEKDGNTIRTKQILTKRALIDLRMTTPNLSLAPPRLAEIYQAEAEEFFNSFQMLDNKTQTARNKGTKK